MSRFALSLLITCVFLTAVPQGHAETKIVLVAGTVMAFDKPGHRDYIAGCKLFASLLEKTDGVKSVVVLEGWPKDEKVFEGAKSVVFFTDGGGKQAYLKTPERVALVQKMVDDGVGIVSFHQAVDSVWGARSIAPTFVTTSKDKEPAGVSFT